MLTLGVAFLTLLVSAGRVAAASKRPFLFSGSTCCVRTTSSSLLLLLHKKIKNVRISETRYPGA